MPRYPIDRATNFIVEDESWIVVEDDHSSVPGIIYLSLTENKVNLIYDDLVNDIADTDKLAKYELLVPAEPQVFAVNDIVNPTFTLTKNGIPNEQEVELISKDTSIVKIINGELKAIHEGEVDILVRLKNVPNIESTVHIIIGNENNESAYIEGPATLKLDRDAIYKLIGTGEITDTVLFTIDSTAAKIIEYNSDNCRIKANDKNRLEKFTLTAVYNNKTYTKTIQIIPLW